LFLFYQEKRKEKISIKILFSCLILICSIQKVSAESLGKYKNIEQKLSTGQLALEENQEQKKAELRFCFFSILF
jgi:hypothetical protein